MTSSTLPDHPIRVERDGAVAIIIPSPEATTLSEGPLTQAATAALTPIQADPPVGIVMDLSRVDFFGSLFIAFLVRCHKVAKKNGGRMAVAGASPRIRELLHLAALDSMWGFHKNRAEAVQTLATDPT